MKRRLLPGEQRLVEPFREVFESVFIDGNVEAVSQDTFHALPGRGFECRGLHGGRRH